MQNKCCSLLSDIKPKPQESHFGAYLNHGDLWDFLVLWLVAKSCSYESLVLGGLKQCQVYTGCSQGGCWGTGRGLLQKNGGREGNLTSFGKWDVSSSVETFYKILLIDHVDKVSLEHQFIDSVLIPIVPESTSSKATCTSLAELICKICRLEHSLVPSLGSISFEYVVVLVTFVAMFLKYWYFNMPQKRYILRHPFKPHWLKMGPNFLQYLLPLLSQPRKPILDLHEKFECGAGWHVEATLNTWVCKQGWRRVLPLSFFEWLTQNLAYRVTFCLLGFWPKIFAPWFEPFTSKVWSPSAWTATQWNVLYMFFLRGGGFRKTSWFFPTVRYHATVGTSNAATIYPQRRTFSQAVCDATAWNFGVVVPASRNILSFICRGTWTNRKILARKCWSSRSSWHAWYRTLASI